MQLEVAAPIAGKAVDVEETLAPDVWVQARSRPLSVIDPAAVTVGAYVDEADLERIAPGDGAIFFAPGRQPHRGAAARDRDRARQHRQLADPALAVVHGGPIAMRAPKQNEWWCGRPAPSRR